MYGNGEFIGQFFVAQSWFGVFIHQWMCRYLLPSLYNALHPVVYILICGVAILVHRSGRTPEDTYLRVEWLVAGMYSRQEDSQCAK